MRVCARVCVAFTCGQKLQASSFVRAFTSLLLLLLFLLLLLLLLRLSSRHEPLARSRSPGHARAHSAKESPHMRSNLASPRPSAPCMHYTLLTPAAPYRANVRACDGLGAQVMVAFKHKRLQVRERACRARPTR